MDADAQGSGSTKRTAPEGTPDREAEARSKMPSTELMPRALVQENQDPIRIVCNMGMLKLELFAVYFPTSWDDIIEVEGMYTLLQVLLENCVSRGACPILGGDFNACIGLVSKNDDVDLVGCSGFGERNAQGMFSHNGLCKMDFTLPTGKNQPTRLKTVGLAGVQVTEF